MKNALWYDLRMDEWRRFVAMAAMAVMAGVLLAVTAVLVAAQAAGWFVVWDGSDCTTWNAAPYPSCSDNVIYVPDGGQTMHSITATCASAILDMEFLYPTSSVFTVALPSWSGVVPYNSTVYTTTVAATAGDTLTLISPEGDHWVSAIRLLCQPPPVLTETVRGSTGDFQIVHSITYGEAGLLLMLMFVAGLLGLQILLVLVSLWLKSQSRWW